MFPLNFKHQIIHIPSLAAAPIKLNIQISVEDLMKAVYEEDEARRAKSNEEAERTLLARRKSAVIISPASVTLINECSQSLSSQTRGLTMSLFLPVLIYW